MSNDHRSAIQRSHQSVFRLAQRDASGAVTTEDRLFQVRRAHKKSRGGCEACKRRRVKCDEAKASCARCVRGNLTCNYPSASVPPRSTASSPDGTVYTMSVALLTTQLSTLLDYHPPSPGASPTNELRMLQHFQAATSRSIGSPVLKQLLHDNVWRRAWDHPYLMHMALAVSAAHLTRLRADSSFGRAGERLSVTEARHWQRALLLHGAELAQPSGAYDTRYDARVETTLLTIIYLFALEDDLPLHTFSSTSDEALAHATSPLAACSGFRALRINAAPRESSSVWIPVLAATDDERGTFTSETPGIEGLPPAFIDLCDLDEHSTVQNNDYHGILRLLTPILSLPPSVDNFPRLFAFAGRSWLRFFKPLVKQKDHRALLLMSYWFALLHQIDQWWLTTRAKTACEAIVAYLSACSQDARLLALLEYPTSFGKSGLSAIWCSHDSRTAVSEAPQLGLVARAP
ncbi:hypothetical protein LTR53_008181 [Teratosphaeriaceae sp. CCFEE 6253]|nr:hypothetical protein LTR53_008181 [Teratosphaeriaceae sp. CCFEE 6253]